VLTGTKTIYLLKCDFCGENYETLERPIRSSFIHTIIDTAYDPDGKLQVKSEQHLGHEGHMCPKCFSTLDRMWMFRKDVAEEEIKADMVEPLPPDFLGEETEKESVEEPKPAKVERICKTCAHCTDKSGRGRGMQYRCGLSQAWFLNGLGCDAWREKEEETC
jgi:hypothetical protein